MGKFQKKLSDEQEKELVDDYVVGKAQISTLMRDYDVSRSTVNRVLARNHVRIRTGKPGPGRKRKYTQPKYRPQTLQPCGTDAAYRRHLYNNEPACPACVEAHSDRVRKEKDLKAIGEIIHPGGWADGTQRAILRAKAEEIRLYFYKKRIL